MNLVDNFEMSLTPIMSGFPCSKLGNLGQEMPFLTYAQTPQIKLKKVADIKKRFVDDFGLIFGFDEKKHAWPERLREMTDRA